MKVYILTREPYHDNSSIVGVYTDEVEAVAALKAIPDPTNINEDDYALTQWDVAKNERGQEWYMLGKQVSDGKKKWNPVRVDFTFCESKAEPV